MKYKNATWTLWTRTQSGEIAMSFPQLSFDANIRHVFMTICKKFGANIVVLDTQDNGQPNTIVSSLYLENGAILKGYQCY